MTDKNKITVYCLKRITWNIYKSSGAMQKYGSDFFQAIAYCDIVRTFNKQGHDLADRAIAFGRWLHKNEDKIKPTFKSIDDLPGMLEIYDSVKSLTNV